MTDAGEQGRIPLVAVSGTRGRIETTQLIARCLRSEGHQVARADSSGLYLGERCIKAGNGANADGARRALMNPSASAAVLEVAEHSVLEEGLCFDLCQVAVVTSTEGADAVARPGVEDRAAVDKAIRAPVDVVAPQGFAVLNADDPAVVAMAERATGSVVWFGGSPETAPIKEHVARGGAALVRLGSQLHWWHRGEKSPPWRVAWLTESTAPTLVEPVMAAAAAVLALGVSRSAVEDLINKSAH